MGGVIVIFGSGVISVGVVEEWIALVLINGAVFFIIVVDLFFDFLRVLRLVRDWRIIFFLIALGSGSITDFLLGCGGWEVGLDMCGCFRGSACC